MTSAREVTLALGGSWRSTGGMALCPVHDDRTPSLSIRDGEVCVLFKCFAGCNSADIVHELRQCGILDDPERYFRKPKPAQLTPVSIEHKPDPAALALWRAAEPAAGTVVETYLRGRGIDALPVSIRCGSTVHAGRIQMPTMLAAVQAPGGAVVAVQSTLLTHAGRKASASVPRITTGALGVGAVRFAPVDSVLGLAEGVETALAAQQLTGVPCWAALGAARMHRIQIPDRVSEIHIFGDADDAGRAAAERTAAANASRRVVLRFPPDGCKDWNDVLCRSGVAA